MFSREILFFLAKIISLINLLWTVQAPTSLKVALTMAAFIVAIPSVIHSFLATNHLTSQTINLSKLEAQKASSK